MKEVISEDLRTGEKNRVITRLYKTSQSNNYPSGLKFCIQHLYWRHEEWIELVRIDNYLHQNKTGTHIHFFNTEQVEWEEIGFQEARLEAERIAKKIIEIIEGRQNGED